MDNLTPLQHFAKQLREDLKSAEQRQYNQQNKIGEAGRLLINNFASSFSNLYSMLIGSSVNVGADTSALDAVIVLSYHENHVRIVFDKTIDTIHSWSLFDKIYKATIPNKNFGMPADREDEHKLIIAIDESLFQVNPLSKDSPL